MMKMRLLFVVLFAMLVLESSNARAQWQPVTAIPEADVRALYVDGNTIYAGADSIVHISTNNGATWTATNFVTTRPGGVEAIIVANGNLYVGTFARGVFVSSNNGQSWQPLNTGLSGLGALSISSFAEKNDKLYVATYGAGVFVLDLSNPVQWNAFNSNFPLNIAGTVYALTLSGNALVAGAGANGFVYRFPEGATGWTEVPIIPPIRPGLAAFDFASSASQLFVATNDKVYRSVDDGQSWTFAGNGLINGSESVLAVAGQTLFAGINFGFNRLNFYLTKDLGDTWQLIGEIFDIFLYDLAVYGGNLYAARHDGLWFAPLSTLAVEDRVKESVAQIFNLEQNYPNPFSANGASAGAAIDGPQTTMTYALPKAAWVTLKVYDTLGRQVATLVQRERKAAGVHRTTFDGQNLPSGLYFYRLEADGSVITKKMVLAR